jgi:hypothetical protein
LSGELYGRVREAMRRATMMVRAEAYAAFVEVSQAAVLGSTDVPARLGGCVVRQVVSQPFGFELKQY